MADQATQRWTDDTVAVFEDGTKIPTTNACFHCSLSLRWCYCHLVGRTPKAVHPNGTSGYQDVRLEGALVA